MEKVEVYQEKWSQGIVAIGKAYTEGRDFESCAKSLVDSLYAYDLGPVLFKPTKAAEQPFRGDKESALSYFVARNGGCEEDSGFALQPWVAVRFVNHNVITMETSALAMGHYFFKNREGEETKVEYSFSYILDNDGSLRINLHHSSLPFSKT